MIFKYFYSKILNDNGLIKNDISLKRLFKTRENINNIKILKKRKKIVINIFSNPSFFFQNYNSNICFLMPFKKCFCLIYSRI